MDTIKLLADLGKNDLAIAGGKGANLGALISAGLPVPAGFCVTTAAYRDFVVGNEIEPGIKTILDATRMNDPAGLESASQAIRDRFMAGLISPELASQVQAAYQNMGKAIPVAVRSSATAEDLPGLSFAGQQDTYLNIVGEEAVLEAVRCCWASLWTARAIGYRARNHIAQDTVMLAVVVQQMVQSEVSGVLFSANPLTGKRDETVIDATFGLGEALVSGQVEPDHYVVDAAGIILSKALGAKALAIHAQAGGGTQTTSQQAASLQALPDEAILKLAELGQQAVMAFGCPQDMEWAWAGGKLYVVQSRPITSLYPLPESCSPERFEVLFSFAAWQGMLDPFTPLGQDIFTTLISGAGRLFDAKVRPEDQRVFLTAGERFYVNITGPLSLPVGHIIAGVFIDSIDPVSADSMNAVLKDARMPAAKISPRTALKLARGLFPIAFNAIRTLLFPANGRARLERKIQQALELVQGRCEAVRSLAELPAVAEDSALSLPKILFPVLLPAVIAGQIPLQGLIRRSANIEGGPALVLDLTRGLPHNVTTEMDLALWRTSQVIKADPESTRSFVEKDAQALTVEYQAGGLPPAARGAIGDFLQTYGLRGIGEIDLGRTRWVEDPVHIFQVLQSYLQISDESRSPEVVFSTGAEQAAVAQEKLVRAFRQRRGGFFKATLARAAAHRVRELTGLRESPKFAIVRLLGHLRLALLRIGRQLAEEGRIKRAEDLFFLHLPELAALGRGEPRDWRGLVAERRATYEQESRRKRIPRLILSDGTTYYETAISPEEGADTLSGSPVSAGVVEGLVHVIIDPHREQLLPGEILVCPATDPAWTPLFLAAGGLVMEVGGMITHGSVVAREYGIPAVVGVSAATERLKTGDRVRVDGTKGVVTILD